MSDDKNQAALAMAKEELGDDQPGD